jgi:hypothetical protein
MGHHNALQDLTGLANRWIMNRLPPRSTARTPASGAGYRGSNPWGAAKSFVLVGASRGRRSLRDDRFLDYCSQAKAKSFHHFKIIFREGVLSNSV